MEMIQNPYKLDKRSITRVERTKIEYCCHPRLILIHIQIQTQRPNRISGDLVANGNSFMMIDNGNYLFPGYDCKYKQ